ncbi:hypothetical protein [Spiroplasma attinicola]|nr:hypothetical protein [Spiroplasma sp. JKS002670]
MIAIDCFLLLEQIIDNFLSKYQWNKRTLQGYFFTTTNIGVSKKTQNNHA